jgi:transposase
LAVILYCCIFALSMEQVIKAHIDYKNLYFLEQKTSADLRVEIAALTFELSNLKRLIYGTKAEKFNPQQAITTLTPTLFPLDPVTTITEKFTKEVTVTKKDKTKTEVVHNGRNPLPTSLRRVEIILEPVQNIDGLQKIGEEVFESLEYNPGSLFVNKYIRPKYAMPVNDGLNTKIIIAEVADRPLPKAIAGASLLSHILIDKYVDHLPIYRQQERFKREGVVISDSTIGDWIAATYTLIYPLAEALKKELFSTNYLHADETPIKVLDKAKKGTTHRGYFWVYKDGLKPLIYFDYRQGRGADAAQEMLKDYQGYLQTDGYCGYEIFKKNGSNITVLHCMAHARRKFFEAQANNEPIAQYALQQISLLYGIEKQAKENQLSVDEIFKLRQRHAVPILQKLGEWMKAEYVKLPPKSVIAIALNYSITRWEQLCKYTTNGILNIDNNPIENSIRPVAIGRKNYLFAGSHDAAVRSALIYSLVGSCKLNNINPYIWLTDILQRIAKHPINSIKELLPHKWTPLI